MRTLWAWVERGRALGADVKRRWMRGRRWRDHLFAGVALVGLAIFLSWVVDFGKSTPMPDVEGMYVQEAVRTLNEAGIPFEAEGVYGQVIRQWPDPGEPTYSWRTVRLTYLYAGEDRRIDNEDDR